MAKKINVYVSFFTDHKTWNVVEELTNNCLTFGTTGDCDQWLFFNKDTHTEIKGK